MTTRKNHGLDVIRGLAAVLVLLGHTRTSLGSALGVELPHGFGQKLLLAPTSLAQESVGVFFVLSGYLVGTQVLSQLERERFGWVDYAVRRLSRIWTVLLPGLVVTAVLDLASHHAHPAIWARVSHDLTTPSRFACNATFLQDLRCPTYGSNEALWSLAYELWFYVVFAAVAAIGFAAVRRDPRRLAVAAVLFVAGLLIPGVQVLTYMVSWLFGVVVGRTAPRVPEGSWLRTRSAVVAAVALTLASMLVSDLVEPARGLNLVLVGACSSPLVLVVGLQGGWEPHRALRWLPALGTISFSLYVFHCAIVKLLVTLVAGHLQVATVPDVAMVYVLAAVTLVLCLPLWWLTERNTERVKAAAYRLVRT